MILLAHFTGRLTLHGMCSYNDKWDKMQPNDMISACTMSETFLSHSSKGGRMDFNHILEVIALYQVALVASPLLHGISSEKGKIRTH